VRAYHSLPNMVGKWVDKQLQPNCPPTANLPKKSLELKILLNNLTLPPNGLHLTLTL